MRYTARCDVKLACATLVSTRTDEINVSVCVKLTLSGVEVVSVVVASSAWSTPEGEPPD